MIEARVYLMDGTEAGKIELPGEYFGVNVSTHVLWEVVRAESVNARRGTASTLGRSEVKATGRKPYRQKGTGNARAGTFASPIWRGGGVTFGPKSKKWNKKVNRKVRRKALSGILSERLAEGNFKVIRDLSSTGKTREIADMLNSLETEDRKRKTILLIENSENSNLIVRASSNIPLLTVAYAQDVSVSELVDAEVVFLSESAMDSLKERLK